MKVHSYFLGSVCHLALHRSLETRFPLDVNLISYRIGKALGFVQ